MVQNVPLLKFICANGPKCTFGKELFRQMVLNLFLDKCYFVKWYKMCIWKSVISSIGTKCAFGKELFRQRVPNLCLDRFHFVN